MDPAVRTGKLDNGLTYYIRKNTKPEKRVEMRLVVNAGSIQEDEDQRGAAHFVEHLGFRGTRRFPGDTLIHYLQSVGANVGPDVNAHTGFDETLYSLTVPSDTMEGVRRGLDILGDWAGAVSFVPAEIDKERGVVLEEWRLGRGAEQRMSDKIIPVLFKDSKYARRLPIGTKEAIEGIPSEVLRRFYHDWYRPDNMAVVIVGDIDPGQIEAAMSMGMGWGLTMRRVILPQAFKIVLPPYGNIMIMMLKDSSQASTITVAELALQGKLIAVSTFNNATVFNLVAMLYLIMCIPLILIVRHFEKQGGRR